VIIHVGSLLLGQKIITVRLSTWLSTLIRFIKIVYFQKRFDVESITTPHLISLSIRHDPPPFPEFRGRGFKSEPSRAGLNIETYGSSGSSERVTFVHPYL